MPADSLSLRHFVIGKFTRSPHGAYAILALSPADDLPLFSAIWNALASTLTIVAEARTTEDIRLVLPSNIGPLYIRQFPSLPTEPGGRPVVRAHIVQLDFKLLSDLDWRPWALDAWLATGIGDDRLIGPHGMDRKVVADRSEVELPIEVKRALLPAPKAPSSELSRQFALGAQYLASGWSVCIREERTPREDMLEIVSRLLAATGATVGAALDVPASVRWQTDLAQAAEIRVMSLREQDGRIPDSWPELALLREVPRTAVRRSELQALHITVPAGMPGDRGSVATQPMVSPEIEPIAQTPPGEYKAERPDLPEPVPLSISKSPDSAWPDSEPSRVPPPVAPQRVTAQPPTAPPMGVYPQPATPSDGSPQLVTVPAASPLIIPRPADDHVVPVRDASAPPPPPRDGLKYHGLGPGGDAFPQRGREHLLRFRARDRRR